MTSNHRVAPVNGIANDRRGLDNAIQDDGEPMTFVLLGDLAEFFRAFAIELQLSTLDRSDRVLSQARSSLMVTPQSVLPIDLAAFLGSHSGLGIFLNGGEGSRWFSHAGGNAGYVAYMIADFSGHGAVIMTSSDAFALIVEILAAIAREYHWQDFSLPEISNHDANS